MLSELLFVQYAYDCEKHKIEQLDIEYGKATAVYNNERRIRCEAMDKFCNRLNELETAAKNKSEQEKGNNNE